jgi:2-oxoglutarate dehydrogenase E1 component
LTEGQFQVVIPEVDGLDVAKVRRVVLCCGKVYYDLLQARRDGDHKHVALIRLEQLYPFPKDALNTVLAPFSHVEQFIWCQEEPENQGVWLSLQHDMRACLQGAQTLVYAGRPPSASPAVGSAALHAQQQHDLVEQALLK